MITIEQLLGMNQFICEDCGQESIVINKSALLSALGTQQWYSAKCMRSAALIRSLVIGHGFQDGNKRTAACSGMLIKQFECSEDTMIECILNVATGDLKDVYEIAYILYPDSLIKEDIS